MNPFSSFRAQMVLFVATMMLATIVGLFLLNQTLEQRITTSAEAQFNEVNQAVDIALNSFPSGQYLYKLIPSEGLDIDDTSTIRNILITNTDGEVIDSNREDDIGKKLDPAIAALPLMRHAEPPASLDARGHLSRIQFPITTDKGTRTVIVVISLRALSQVVKEVGRMRILATIVLGMILLFLTALISRQVTRPITELARAAQRVTNGDLDFQVPVTQRSEIGTLSRTFNDMLNGLQRNRELEDQLQRAERSAVVGRLASGIAHEIRNPLNFMNLSIDHLQSRITTSPDDPVVRQEAIDILGRIKGEIGRLNRMVSDFLAYGRPSKLKIREVDVGDLLEEVVALVSTQASQQGVRINLLLPSGLSPILEADSEQIKTCFSNLVINAVQAMPDGGTLDIGVHREDGEIRFEFKDTGHGIAPEALELIFEPYYSTKETGIGLGLPLTKRLIEDHGGTIKAESTEGKGTLFTVSLPRRHAVRQP